MVMAATGAALVGFAVGHMVGNLQVFLGPEAINRYGHFLQSTPELLWPARIGLLTMVGLHIWSAIRLSAENRAARPTGYAGAPSPKAASYASRTMLMSGLIIVSFIIYHLLHYTVQVPAVNLKGADYTRLVDASGHHDIYRMIISGFSHPLVSLFYLLAIGLLCLHLSHGIQALFQSLGLKNKAWRCFFDRLAVIGALVLFAGYASIPIGVLIGIIK